MKKNSLDELEELNLITFTDIKKNNESESMGMNTESNKSEIDADKLKFMIDSSLIGLFGIFDTNKIKYSLKKSNTFNTNNTNSTNGFILKTYKKYI